MFANKRWLWSVVLCAAGVAFGQAPKPSVMPFPLEFKRTPSGFSKEDKESLQREYNRLLRLAGALVPDFARYDLALKELKRQDCEREDECLVQLAKKAEALYGLYANVDYSIEGAVLVTGRVVRDDGKVAAATQTVKLPKGKDPFKDIAKNGLVQLFAQLKVGELEAVRAVEPVKVVEPTKPVEPVKVEVKDPPPPPPPLVIEDRGAGQRSLGKTLVIAGGGVAVAGAVVGIVGAIIGNGAERAGDPAYAKDPAAARNLATGQTMATVGFIGVGVGVVVGAVGAAVWGAAPPAPVTQVAVSPVAGGAVVQFGGRF